MRQLFFFFLTLTSMMILSKTICAQEEYERAAEQRSEWTFKFQQLETELRIADLIGDDTMKESINKEYKKLEPEVIKFMEKYPLRYFQEIGPEKIIRVEQIEADVKTKHRNEIYRMEKIDSLLNSYENIKKQLGKVAGAYQRKYDIIVNIISATKSDPTFWEKERQCIENIINLRAEVSSNNAVYEVLDSFDSNSLIKFQEIHRLLDSAVENLKKKSYQYSALRNNDNFKNWYAQFNSSKENIINKQIEYNELYNSFILSVKKILPEYKFISRPLFSLD